MTCIVGLEHKNKVYLGCDSVASDGYVKYAIHGSKIFTTGPLTIGYTSSFRFADILQYDLNLPLRTENDGDDRKFLVSVVVKTIREALSKGGFNHINNSKESGGTCLIAYKNKLYKMQDDYSITKTDDGYDSCGSGSYFALGALAATQGKSTPIFLPKDRVKVAIEAAIKHCATVTGPVHIVECKL